MAIAEYPGPYSPTQPLPRLEDFLVAVLRLVVPDNRAKRFDAAKLKEIEKDFRPFAPADGMGCMKAAYEVLDILYGERFSEDLKNEVIKRAYAAADAARNTKAFKQKVEEAKAANPNFTDADARHHVREQWASAHNSSDHTFALMAEKGLAGEKVHTPTKDAEQVIRSLTGTEPGAYFFGMAVKDNHTVTLAVKIEPNGKQTMYWLDQTTPGLSKPITDGKLGDALKNTWGYTNSTNIYPLRPPASGAP